MEDIRICAVERSKATLLLPISGRRVSEGVRRRVTGEARRRGGEGRLLATTLPLFLLAPSTPLSGGMEGERQGDESGDYSKDA